MARVTQKLIARKLGLSPSLVSRALSGKAQAIGSKEETTRKIVITAQRMGYIPSAAARHLRGEGSSVIGVVVADIGDPFLTQVMTEVVRQGHEKGHSLAVAGFHRRIFDQRDISLLLEQELAGLLLIGGGPMEWITSISVRNLNTVRIGPIEHSARIHQIGPDESEGFHKLVEYLVASGHQRAGIVSADLSVHHERTKLIKTIANQYGLHCSSHHIAVGSDQVLEAGLEGGNKIIQQAGTSLPSAIICSSDTVAMGVLSALSSNGISIPGDVSVTGFDGLMLSQLTSPPLTTLAQPIEAMVEQALTILEKGKPGKSEHPLPVSIVIRSSTGPARKTKR